MKKRLIVVLGMHRSGTSVVARSLQTMEIDLGTKLMPPVKGNNEKGFWEDMDVYKLNTEILNFLQHDWHFVSPASNDQYESLKKSKYFDQAVKLLEAKTSQNIVFGLKEPRIAILLPFWKAVFAYNQLNVSYLISLRNPLNVCQSLSKRDGFPIQKGGFLWLKYMLAIFTETIGEKRILVNYDALINAPWAETPKIASKLHLPINVNALKIFCDDFLDRGLRHNVHTFENLLVTGEILPLAHKIYLRLLQASQNQSILASANFETEVVEWNTHFSNQHIALQLVDIEVAGRHRDVTQRDAEIAEREIQIAQKDAEITEKDSRIADKDIQIAAKNIQVTERNTQIATLQQRITASESLLNEIQSSKAWRVSLFLRKIRLTLIPPESFRAHFARQIINRLYLNKILREERKKAKICLTDFQPRVSVIIPNYNHEKYLRQRIESILTQSYRNFDILILDDCSTDQSQALIKSYADQYPEKIHYLFNKKNSGNTFSQWRKGIEHIDGELVWICESDDFTEPDFLDQMVGYFSNPAVNIAFGRIQFCDLKGRFQKGLDNYREGAEKNIWHKEVVRPAYYWFANGFGVNNVIANVGGCVFRRHILPDAVWQIAETYSVVGDWFLYIYIANGGIIVYNPDAVTYFRQHTHNTSVASFRSARYYKEHQQFMEALKNTWDIPDTTLNNFIEKIKFQYNHFKIEKKLGPFNNYIKHEKLLQKKREKLHILIGILGFSPGGGELFPIHLANQLQKTGSVVSLFVYDMNEVNLDMYNTLNPGIAVYTSAFLHEVGIGEFVKKAGISIVHSHMISVDAFFFNHHNTNLNIPYIVTLHGSYDFVISPEKALKSIVSNVDHWVYTADKNLDILRIHDIPKKKLTKLHNAMPGDANNFPLSREELNIKADTFVFSFVARGIPEKGWNVAIQAFCNLRNQNPNTPMHLLLCGTGEETDKYQQLYTDDPGITFLGYQQKINGLYRISNCALVPTRFKGESYPLVLIQAMHESLPIIATDIGEIKNMMTTDGGHTAGIIVEYTENTEIFINSFTKAMQKMFDIEKRHIYIKISAALGKKYSMNTIAQEYLSIYQNCQETSVLNGYH